MKLSHVTLECPLAELFEDQRKVKKCAVRLQSRAYVIGSHQDRGGMRELAVQLEPSYLPLYGLGSLISVSLSKPHLLRISDQRERTKKLGSAFLEAIATSSPEVASFPSPHLKHAAFGHT